MLFSGRAYYNLLLLQKQRDGSTSIENWDNTDYRLISCGQLLEKLEKLGLNFTVSSFSDFANNFDTPEQLCDQLDEETKERAYVIFFELWRRHLEDKETISIFCDNLDRKIAAYEKESDDEALYRSLKKAIEILERNLEFGCSPKNIFEKFSLYVAHDLEHVIYTYINAIIKKNKENEALDLIECFLPYVKERQAIQFLKLKAMSDVFDREKEKLALFLLSSLQENLSMPLAVNLLFYLIEKSDIDKFSELFSFLVTNANKEEDLLALLDVLMAYHNKFNQKEKKIKLEKLSCVFSTKKKKTLSKKQKLELLSYL